MMVTVNVVDCTHGRPAEGVSVRLERRLDGAWGEQSHGQTDEKGGITWEATPPVARCLYRLELDIDAYFSALGIVPSHPSVTVVFRVFDHAEDQHIPVLITPHAHLTFRARQ